jgi:hypothetical protein
MCCFFAESGKSVPNLLDYDNLDLIASNLDPWAHLHDSEAKVRFFFVFKAAKFRSF